MPRSLDEEFIELAEKVPGFGGLVDDPTTGETIVRLSDPLSEPLARPVIEAYLSRNGSKGWRLQVVPADYDFRELIRWRRAVEQAVPSAITFSDADEVRNRVAVGVRDDDGDQTVRNALTRLGIPREAVLIERRPTAIIDNLRSLTRPVFGGLQIGAAGGECTLGFIVLREWPFSGIDVTGPRYVITKSHCTTSMGAVTGDIIGQPTELNRIGVELSDPPFVGNSIDPMCPVAWNGCRRSDAAMFLLDDNSGTASSFNVLALSSPVATPTVPQLLGTATYSGRQQGFRSGMRVDKSGRSTGQTAGTVRSTCVNVQMTGYWMVCQFTAGYNSAGGDSGSPVWFTDASGQRWVMGIHWGRSNVAPFDRFFSGWLDVRAALANDILFRTGQQWTPAFTPGPVNFGTF